MVTRRRLLQGASTLALLGGMGLRANPAVAWGADADGDGGKALKMDKGDRYVPVTGPKVKKKMEQWHDWKFGAIFHWGTYSTLGIVESWSICSEDEPWCKRPEGIGYVDWKRRYEQLSRTFNPRRFNPAEWAKAVDAACMRYLVFTTKHHDGFCMFDTAQTDYRITSRNVPFHDHPHANITKALFDAFRKRGLGIGAYFSKADWHSPYYCRRNGPPLHATTTTIPVLASIVARGGNLLLGIGPKSNGELPAPALLRLKEIGRWMDVNAGAIHGTRRLPLTKTVNGVSPATRTVASTPSTLPTRVKSRRPHWSCSPCARHTVPKRACWAITAIWNGRRKVAAPK